MMAIYFVEKAETYLQKLCVEIPGRRVGSTGNRAATDFFSDLMTTFGFKIETPIFDCIDWSKNGVQLTVDTSSFEVFVSPYSLGCDARAPLVVASTVEELAAVAEGQAIMLLRGELTREPLMPKNFPFYNPDEHKHIIQLLETKKPQAIIAATSCNPELAGAVYPFPLIEDGDFNIPCVHMTEEEGARLAVYVDQCVSLDIQATRSPATGCNVIARKGVNTDRRVVLFAHIDAKDDTPGAIDNASGIIVLLLLSELLADHALDLGIEIVALNGEDYYSSPGQQQYLAINTGRFDEIVLGINIDGVGYYHGNTAYSLYGCPPEFANLVEEAFSTYGGLSSGPPWYQGDHNLFLLNHRPALAMTSEHLMDILSNIVHTPEDRPENVVPAKLVSVAFALCDLMLRLDQLPT